MTKNCRLTAALCMVFGLIAGCGGPASDSSLRYCAVDDFRGGFAGRPGRYHAADDTIHSWYKGPDRLPAGTAIGRVLTPPGKSVSVNEPYWAKGSWSGSIIIQNASTWKAGEPLMVEFVADRRTLEWLSIEVLPGPERALRVDGRTYPVRNEP